MKRRYAVAISAMIMAMPFGQTASAADPTLEQLEVIQDLLESKDVARLRRYLFEHPELLEGYTPLSQLLVQYMMESRNMFDFLGIDQSDDDSAIAPSISLY